MAHEELKKQFEEDVKQYGADAHKMWELKGPTGWKQCFSTGPEWGKTVEYRRKEPPFKPEYYSGLNWRDALPLVGKVVEFSDNGEDWGKPRKLVYIHEKTACRRYESPSTYWEYIRTTPETHAHPTITLTVNGREWVLPKPETEAPKMDTPIWVFNIYTISETRWCGAIADSKWLKGGCVHLTEDRAQAWADFWREAILGVIK